MSNNNIKSQNHLSDMFYRFAGANTTMTKQELQETLMSTGGQIIAGGHLRNIKSKHLGAGIYYVWTTDWWNEEKKRREGEK